jgi:hypothetical protein
MNNLTPKNQKIINERFGSLSEAVKWFNGADEDVLSTILNDLIDGFEPKKQTKKKRRWLDFWKK